MEFEQFGTTLFANNIPANVDPYETLEFCDNVEREGEGSYRFDGVNDMAALMSRLTMMMVFDRA
jgi:hypothetical protein